MKIISFLHENNSQEIGYNSRKSHERWCLVALLFMLLMVIFVFHC